ncbi:hypothetical protein Z043_118723 [Scleropages formosus]|uniref:Uncharacterized protein n=1 Tax=Scleropages formosus TaxID=113540 RepID=A0A0P7YAJ9_SCLFO|nr:hypothetical protein Z043_118723 [Scleropages formosus]
MSCTALHIQGFQGKTGPPGPAGVVGPQVRDPRSVAAPCSHVRQVTEHEYQHSVPKQRRSTCLLNVFRVNREKLGPWVSEDTQGHPVYLESRAYLELLAKKVPRVTQEPQGELGRVALLDRVDSVAAEAALEPW